VAAPEAHNRGVLPRGSLVLVTGASRRLGRAIALRLARGGHAVAVHWHHSRDEAAATVAAARRAGAPAAAAFRADLASAAAPARLVAAVESKLGPIEALVNSASIFRPAGDAADAARDMDAHVAVNLRAPYLLALACAPGMRRRGRGRIVNLGDIHAVAPLGGHAAYVASKAGLHALTLALARDLAPEVSVNCVAPGAVLLPEGAPASARRRLERANPKGRLGTPDEVAEAVAFFVDGPEFISGQILRVDGARLSRP
jgi:pteridine reductase